MRSAPLHDSAAATSPRRANPDLTARAALRQAALELFAEHGVDGVSVRDIAARAGVSPALLFHHYGTKDGLREAVDEWLTQTVAEAVADAEVEVPGDIEDLFANRLRVFATVSQTQPECCAYIARSLSAGGDQAKSLFDRMYDATAAELDGLEARGLVAGTDDELARAMMLLFLQLGPVMLQPLIEPYLGESIFTDRSVDRWVAACAKLLSGRFVADGAPRTANPLANPKESR